MLHILVLGGIIENQNSASSRHKAKLALWRDEVRILIFDDPAENERGQRHESGSNPHVRAAGARCMNFFFEKLRNPARSSARVCCASFFSIKFTVCE
jgi:hypothetical protein